MKLVPFTCDEVKCNIKIINGKCPVYPDPPAQTCAYIEPVKHCTDQCIKPLEPKILLESLSKAKKYQNTLKTGASIYLNECIYSPNGGTKLYFAQDANLYLLDNNNEIKWQTKFTKSDGRYSFSNFDDGRVGLFEKIKDVEGATSYFLFPFNQNVDKPRLKPYRLQVDDNSEVTMYDATNLKVFSLKSGGYKLW